MSNRYSRKTKVTFTKAKENNNKFTKTYSTPKATSKVYNYRLKTFENKVAPIIRNINCSLKLQN